MRVLAYSDSPLYSGAEAVFAQVCEGLASAGVLAGCAVAPANADLRSALEQGCGDLPLVAVPAQQGRVAAVHLWGPRRLFQIRRALDSVQWDALLVNLPSLEYGSAPALVMDRSRPALGLVHIHHSPRSAGFRWGGVRELLARPGVRRFDHLQAVSPHAIEELPAVWHVPRARVSILPLPRPHIKAEDAASARRALGLPADRPVIGLVGRLSSLQKGHDILLAAAPLLLERRPDVVFAFVGEGPDRDAIAADAARRGISDAVRMVGAVRPVDTAFAALDRIAMPSRFEGLPLVALEALEAGVAGVATDVDGLRAVWPSAWRVPPEDPEALAAALLKTLDEAQGSIDRHLAEGREAMMRFTSDAPHVTVLAALRRAMAQVS